MEENTVERNNQLQAQDDAAQDAASGERENTREETYYRSQKEVDEAFGKRLAQERKKWEKEASLHAELERLKERSLREDLRDVSDAGYEKPKSEFIQSILQQTEALKRDYPEFSMEEAMQNPLFAMMLAKGESLERVADYFYPERAREKVFREAEDEVLERIRRRNARPHTMAHANQGEIYRDIGKLSDEEILDIDRRVKRGERVIL